MSKINFHNVQTMIGPDAHIQGPITLDEGIIIYGKVNGDVDSKGPVRIAMNAVVNGNIKGSGIQVGGEVTGNIESNGQVILGSKCILKGDIIYRTILIEDGAQFEGKCDIIEVNNNS